MRIETKKITNASTHGIITFSHKLLEEYGMPAGKDYYVIYNKGIITISKEIEVKTPAGKTPTEPFELGNK